MSRSYRARAPASQDAAATDLDRQDTEIRATRVCKSNRLRLKKGRPKPPPKRLVPDYCDGQILKITPVPGNWTSGASAGSAKRVVPGPPGGPPPGSRTAP